MCSLWKLNNYSKSVSILSRIGYKPGSHSDFEFVHKIENSLIDWILKNRKDSSFVDIPSVSEEPF